MGLADSIIAAATDGGIIPEEIARLSFTPRERIILRVLETGCSPTVGRQSETSGGQYVVYKCGLRVGVRPTPPPEDAQVLFKFALDSAGAVGLRREEARLAIRLRKLRAKQMELLRHLDTEGRLAELLEEIKEIVFHLAPVIAFSEDRVFTSEKYWGANLIDRRESLGLLSSLQETPLDQWSRGEADFIFALEMLRTSGGVYRIEELNWMQVDPYTVLRVLQGILHRYASRGVPLPLESLDRSSDEVPAHAAVVRAARERAGSDFQLYRLINGASLNKQEQCLLRSGARKPRLEELSRASEEMGMDSDVAMLFEAATQALPTLEWLESGALENIYSTILRAALRETGSDFAMSRAPRRLYLDSESLHLPKSEFFCGVIARDDFDPVAAGLMRYTIGEIRWNQAKRMQFNGWKFWYGNLSHREREKGQYWYTPPLMPDIGYQENRLHQGHYENGVCQSIRCPGDLCLFGLDHPKGRIFRGAFDVRLARATMAPKYGEVELGIALGYRDLVGALLQRICNAVQAGLRPRVKGFDKTFHMQSVV